MQRGYSAAAYYKYKQQQNSLSQISRKRANDAPSVEQTDEKKTKIKPQRKVLIPDQLVLAIQDDCEYGMVSLSQFKYNHYNSDFGPFTLYELAKLIKILSKSSHEVIL
jgi:hypothetical protein